ncbi:MAG: cation:proton antiporter [Candidatus Omnitrophica bacterium]|nr:cation:proton antiporter [Candidatus Omnitrophota bacterium]
MNYLSEENIFLFLIQVFLLLGLSRVLGDVFRRWQQPALPAEIAVGIFLGPTILGRFFPQVHTAIFPHNAVQMTMFDTVAWFGVFYLLLETGLEIDLLSAWRQRAEVLKIAISDIVIPIAISFVVFSFLPDHYFPDSNNKFLFLLFLASVVSISAMPIAARALAELKMSKTDLGSLIMSALSVNDILGWLIFAIVLGLSVQGEINLLNLSMLFGATLGFTAVALTIGRKFAHSIVEKIRAQKMPEPGSSLTFISLLALLCGALTHKLGIHAIFGFFLAGIMVGDARSLPEKSRQVISQMVYAIFVPLFFAGIGLKIDFLQNFDFLLVGIFTGLGIFGKFIGAWIGVSLTAVSRSNRLPVAIAHTTGGMMEIVVGLVALENKLISEPIFTAIVCGAVISSITLGPWLHFAINNRKKVSFLEFFNRRGIIANLKSNDKNGAIVELCEMAAEQEGRLYAEDVLQAVITRENIVGTGVEAGIALPHARMPNLQRPIILLGRSLVGIDWNSPDGEKTHFVFLILTPANDDDVQVQILRAISRVISKEDVRSELLESQDNQGLWTIVDREFTVFQIVKR